MQLFKIFICIAACAALLSVGTGCKPSAVTDEPTPAVATCYLESTRENGVYQTKFDYDAQHRIAKAYNYSYSASSTQFTDYLYGSDGKVASTFNAPVSNPAQGYRSEYVYNANGKIGLIKNYDRNNTLIGKIVYNYDGSQRVLREDRYGRNGDPNSLSVSVEFGYLGTDKKPHTATHYDMFYSPPRSYTLTYTYDANDNIINIESADSNGKTVLQNSFDTKKGCLISFAGLGTRNYTGTNSDAIGGAAWNNIFGKNNLVRTIYKTYDANDVLVNSQFISWTFEYNTNDQPIKQTNLLDGSVYTFDYHCY